MFRFIALSMVTLASMLIGVSMASAQVYVRAPFVQVEVGGPGVYVRAPFVSLWIPGRGPVYQATPAFSSPPPPTAPGVFPPPVDPNANLGPGTGLRLTPFGTQPVNPPPPVPVNPAAPMQNLPLPQVVPGTDIPGATPPPPQPLQTRHPTLPEFAKNFQAKAGNYDVTIINPITNQPTQVKFTLPEGSPRRVIVNRDEIEFRYSLRQWVRIEFDKDGAQITSR